MIHHVGLEIRRGDRDACVRFWSLLGWEQVESAAGLDDRWIWVERGGHQLHLAMTDSPTVPSTGHVALVDPSLDETVRRLEAEGIEVSERTRYWGARRIQVRCPAGHLVELMSAPPA